MLKYPSSTGRDFGEVLRVIDSLQMAVSGDIVTPAGWHRGEACMLAPHVSDSTASGFNNLKVVDVASGKKYIRYADVTSEEAKDA